MNIVDAIKSGRPFYRKSWKSRAPITYREVKALTQEAFLADDWEVEEEREVLVTHTQFEKACARVDFRLYISPDSEVYITDYVKALKEELGL